MFTEQGHSQCITDTPSISGDTIVCNQKEAYYSTGVSAISYKWAISNGGIIESGQATNRISVIWDKAGFYTLTLVTLLHCQSTNDTVRAETAYKIAVHSPEPLKRESVPEPVCVNAAAFELNLFTPGDGMYQGDGIKGNILNPAEAGVGKHTVNYVYTDENNCESTSKTIVEILPAHIADAGDDMEICQSNYTLKANDLYKNVTGKWTVIEGNAVIDSPDNPLTAVSQIKEGKNILRWTVTGENNCKASDEIEIINNTVKTTAIAGENQSKCSTFFILNANEPTASGEYGKWSVINGGGEITDTFSAKTSIKNTSVGINILQWSIRKGICSSVDELVLHNTMPAVNAGQDKQVCQSTSILAASEIPAGGTGKWSKANATDALISNINQPNVVVRNLQTGKNTFRWTITDSKNCTNYDHITIVNNTPTDAEAGENQRICSRQTYLNANDPQNDNGGTGTWKVLAGEAKFRDPNKPNTLVSNLRFGTNVMQWTINKGICLSADEVEIRNDGPPVDAGDDQEVCTNSATLSANDPGEFSGQWTSLNNDEVVIENPSSHKTVVRNLSYGKNTFLWTIVGNDCTVADTINVFNNQVSIAKTQRDTAICENHFELTANTPENGTGKWSLISGNGTFDNPAQPNTTIRQLQKGENKLRWTISKGICSSFDNISITNNAIEANAGTNKETCTSSTVLNAQLAENETGKWSVVSGECTFSDSNQPHSEAFNLDTIANVLRWTISANNCTAFDDVTITNNVISANAGADFIVCQNSVTLTAKNPYPAIGKWTIVEGNPSEIRFANPEKYNTEATLSQGTNKLRWTVQKGNCISNSDVEIQNRSFSAEINRIEDVLCAGDCNGSATVTTSIDERPLSYQWNDAEKQTTKKAENLCAGDYSVTVTDQSTNCSQTVGGTINEPENPLAYTYKKRNPKCQQENGWIKLNMTGGTPPYHYQWSPFDTDSPDMFGLPVGTYFFTVIDDNNCLFIDSIVLDYADEFIPESEINGPDTVYKNAEADFVIDYFFPQEYDYQWSTAKGTIVNGQGTSRIHIGWTETGMDTISLVISTPCKSIEIQKIIYIDEVGSETTTNLVDKRRPIDNTLRVIEITKCPGCFPEAEMFIYNMSGSLVYKKREYDNTWKCEQLSAGVYTYKIKLNDKLEKTVIFEVIGD